MSENTIPTKEITLNVAKSLMVFYKDAEGQADMDECLEKLSQMNELGEKRKIFFNVETGEGTYII